MSEIPADISMAPTTKASDAVADVPADLAKSAWHAAAHVYAPNYSPASHSYVRDIIASAILAERERCARCARLHLTHQPEYIVKMIMEGQ